MSLDRRRARRDRRQALRAPAVFAVRGTHRGRVHLAQAEDVGPSGMTLRRPRDLASPLGTTLTLTFSLPGTGFSIDVSGQVMSDRVAGSFRRTGIRFIALATEHEQRIARYCEEQLGIVELAVRVA